jgi:hypothetical protein
MIRTAVFLLALMWIAASAEAAVFPCSEAGLDSAIAEAGLGDAGPHALDCSPGDSFETERIGFFIAADLELDGRGVTIECVTNLDLYQECGQLFSIRSAVECGPPNCSPTIYGPPVTVTLKKFNLLVSGPRARIGVAVSNGADVTLEQFSYRHDEVGLFGTAVQGLTSGLGVDPVGMGELHVLESSLQGVVVVGPGPAMIDRSFIGIPDEIVFSIVNDNSEGQSRVINSTIHGAIKNFGNLELHSSTVIGLEGHPGFPGRFVYDDTGSFRSSTGQAVAISIGDLVITNSILDGACMALYVPDPADYPPGYLPDPLPGPGSLVSLGGNVASDSGSCFLTDATDQPDILQGGLGLLPLGDYFGPTMTHALLTAAPPFIAASPAVDAAVFANCPLIDQRGAPRPETGGNSCDSGSFEAPEPASYAMLVAGIFMLLLLEQRRRAAEFSPSRS